MPKEKGTRRLGALIFASIKAWVAEKGELAIATEVANMGTKQNCLPRFMRAISEVSAAYL